ncbi:MAG: tRNA uridine-5-carboxymethylaminomethyl(34) synthesis GTPase MnmE [Clostridiales bacterium GWB2_37_7]|nr:MAG: tRNA uridine-5-carboxymethylaminomethyl(34) synthesis GTPase MnmE [Clostridiales bacterium GWB2_37_7]
MFDDTIAAIATAPGEAGIGIVRLSGNKAIDILDKLFRGKKRMSAFDIVSRMATYGHIVDEDLNVVDEVLVIIMRKPNSYTTEDVVEIHCHGGIIPVRRIMELVLKNGAVMAEPGEFTKRAFLNGRIDLTQAEAVIDVITSKTETGLNAALYQLEGDLSQELHRIMDEILSILAHIEASIDFPEHDIEEITLDNILVTAVGVSKSIKKLSDSFEEGKIIRDGLSTAIVGRPNVGKSSLLNILVRENRAIVTDVPGTTRDIIEEYLNIGGVLVKLIDTAGIRETEDIVERIGVERTKSAIEEAEVVIFTVDASVRLTREDHDILQLIKTKNVIVAANKIDKGINEDIKILIDIFGEDRVIEMSVKQKIGIIKLEDTIKDLVYHGQAAVNKNKMVTNIRHKDLLDKALDSVNRAIEAMRSGVPIDLISVDIKDAWGRIGQITGDVAEEDIINEIFSKFCIGK